MSTPNRRVQKLLDTAAEHGWTTEHPSPELATWLIYPRNVASDGGFVVYGLPNDAAKVLHAATYKPVTQAEASALIAQLPIEAPKADEPADGEPSLEDVIESAMRLVREARDRGPRRPLDDTGVEVRLIPNDDPTNQDVIVMSEFVVPDSLSAAEKSDYCSGAILAATKVSRLVEKSLEAVTGVLPEEALDGAVVTPPNAAHAYLHLANQVRDPRTLRIIFEDQATPPNEATTRGAQTVCKSLMAVWQAFADGLFALDPNQGASLREFVQTLHEHAEFIRTSADETFGEFVTLSDADFEGLLS